MQESTMKNDSSTAETQKRLGRCLYWRGEKIYARLWVDGRQTWRSTNTDDPATARRVLKEWQKQQVLKSHGIESPVAALDRNRLTAGEVIDAYIKAGLPTKKMQKKADVTIRGEMRALNPARAYFGVRAAVSLTLADCDKYRDWRNSSGYIAERKLRCGKSTKCKTRGGDRGVDMELNALSNALRLAVRRGQLKSNPLTGRTNYSTADQVRHCREVAPTPEGLAQIEHWLRLKGEDDVADFACFVACSGLRISEALSLEWEAVDWPQGVLHVKRAKHGCNPFVPLLPELKVVLTGMAKRRRSFLLFPSPYNPETPRDKSAIRHRIAAACKALGLSHVAPHGLRSYFVTQARQSGLTDAEIAMLIGDKTGPAIIAAVYGDVRPEHLLKQAQRIQLRAGLGNVLSNNLSNVDLSISNSSFESSTVSRAA
jgi:integrase